MSAFFFADLIPGMLLTPLKSSRFCWITCCLFTLFLSLIHYLMLSLNSFTRCFSSLGVLLLNSMILRISAFFLEITSISLAPAVPPSSSPSSLSSSSFLNFVHAVADMQHDRTCLNDRVWEPSVMTIALETICSHFCCVFDRNVLHLTSLQSSRQHPTWFLWMSFHFFLIVLDFLPCRRPYRARQDRCGTW